MGVAKYRFSMIVDGVERTQIVDYPTFGNTNISNPYEQQAIYQDLKAWAISHIKLSYEEVRDDGRQSTASKQDNPNRGQETETSDKG